MFSNRFWAVLGALLVALGAVAATPARAGGAPPLHVWSGSTSPCWHTGFSLTVSSSSGSLVVAFVDSGSSASETFTMGDSASQSWTSAFGPTSDAGLISTAQIFYKANSAALTSVTVTTASRDSCAVTVLEYGGMATSSALDAATGQDNSTASTSCPSGSITTSNASDTVVGFCYQPVKTFAAGGTGCTYSAVAGTYSSHGVEDCNASATGTFSSSISLSGSGASIGFVVAFKQAGGGGGSTCPKTFLTLGVGC